jgi:hypothetical protein
MNIVVVRMAGVSLRSQDVKVAAMMSKKWTTWGSEMNWSTSSLESSCIILAAICRASGSLISRFRIDSLGTSLGGMGITTSPITES